MTKTDPAQGAVEPTPQRLDFIDRCVRSAAYLVKRWHTAGAAVLVRDSEGRILLVQRGVGQRGRWSLPGGFRRNNEEFEQTARRRVLRETGIEPRGLTFVTHYVQRHADHVETLYQVQVPPTVLERSNVRARSVSDLKWFRWDSQDLPPLTLETVEALERIAQHGDEID